MCREWVVEWGDAGESEEEDGCVSYLIKSGCVVDLSDASLVVFVVVVVTVPVNC